MTESDIRNVGADVDVRALMEDIQREVDRKRREGRYPPEILAELEAEAGDVSAGDVFDRILSDLNRVAMFHPDVTTESEKPVVAPLVSGAKRVIRTGVRWYVHAVLQQVGTFAAHTVRALRLAAERTRALEERADRTDQRLDAIEMAQRELSALRDRVELLEGHRAGERLARLDRALRDLRERLEGAGSPRPAEQHRPAGEPRSLSIERSFDYLAFENQFRGSEEEIARRQTQYVDLFRDVPGPVVDLGCGRGEFLGLLRDAGVDAYGVDRHPDMVASAREHGLRVEQADALSHLAALEPGSLGAIFSAQMIEHLDTQQVPGFFEVAADALAPGGVLVVETINPSSLFVFAHAFYVDLGHLRPLHPLTLRFLAEVTGFAEVEVRYLSPPPPDFRPQPIEETGHLPLDGVIARMNENFERIDDILFGPQDYAVIARR